MNNFTDRLRLDKKLKIAIVLDEMSIGGIPKACIPFMKELAKYGDVTLILQSIEGALQNEVPENIRVVCVPKNSTMDILAYLVSNRHFIKAIYYAMMHIIYGHVTKRWVKNWRLGASYGPCIIEDNFDCVIAYHGMNITQLCRTVYQVKARKKVVWIHGDHPFKGKHLKDVKQIYEKFDRAYFDSKICMQNFTTDFPSMKKKAFVGYPLIETDMIIEKSKEKVEIPFKEEDVNILTVGRISPEKGQDLIPDTIIRLRESIQRFSWYLIGDGADRERIETMAREKGCRELHFLGAKTNPYPYMKKCDVYVQPSYSEAYSITAFEAAVLGKISVLTDVAGATEILQDEVTTIVAKPNPDSICEGIKKLINCPEKHCEMEKEIQKYDFSNKNEIANIVDWISK